MSDRNEQHLHDDERQLLRYLDGDMSDHEAGEMDKRIERDDRLQGLLRQYAALDGRLAEMQDRRVDEVDEELLRADIVAALERKVLLEGPSRRSRLLRPRTAALAAAAVAVIAATVALTLFRSPTEPEPPGEPIVRAALHRAGPRDASAVVESRTLPFEYMQMRLSTEAEATPADVPSGTVYVSVGYRREAEGAAMNYPHPVEWTLREMY